MKTKKIFIFWILAVSLLVSACSTNKKTWIANPASTFCEKNWWILELVFQSGSMVWICKFPNWSSCEERAYYNWECKADIDQDTKENTLENTDKNEKNLENELELNKQNSDNNIDDITENGSITQTQTGILDTEDVPTIQDDNTVTKNNIWKKEFNTEKLFEKCRPWATWLSEWDIECMEDIIDHFLPK